jgi:hypothetical protein
MHEYYVDLSPYQANYIELPEVLTIGWLGIGKDFKTGKSSKEFIEKINRIFLCGLFPPSQVYVHELRGYLDCPLCNKTVSILLGDGSTLISTGYGHLLDEYTDDEIFILGHGEVWIPNIYKEGHFFATQDLIYHYILDHQYLPPQEFINSVLQFDLKKEYIAAIESENCYKKYVPNMITLDEILKQSMPNE